MLLSCEPDTNPNPNHTHFKVTVNGTELSADTNYIFLMYVEADSGMGIYASGGNLIYNAFEIYHYNGPGNYPFVGDFHASTGGLRINTIDSIYYIDSYHGTGSVNFETLDYSPGVIHEVKGTFSGTAETDYGHPITLTNGNFYYHEH
jgi:hypothetical protein